MKKKIVPIGVVLVCISSIFLIFALICWKNLVIKTEEKNFNIIAFSDLEEAAKILEQDTLDAYSDFKSGNTNIQHFFAENQLEEKVVYGILNNTTKHFLYISDSGFSENLQTSKYQSAIFANGNFSPSNQHTLVFYFPNHKNSFLHSSYWFLFAIIFFVSIILTVLGIFLSIIYRRKANSNFQDEFIANMTHEMKTPISTISLTCEALSDTSIFCEKELQTKYLNIIKEENLHLQNLVTQILLHASLENGKINLEQEEVDIHTIIKNCAKHAELAITRKNGKTTLGLNAENAIMRGDKLHIHNVISNLLDNAVKYTLTNPIINISTRNIDAGIEIRISDNGIGIEEAEQEKIFQKFYRTSNIDIKHVKGYGIGLNYVKQIVEMHNGTIRLESNKNEGSTFILYFPR